MKPNIVFILADRHPATAHRLLMEPETWLEEVEAGRATIDDVW